ncbi:MAG: AsmA-like C-terminal region-containing protein [Candidatus Competibacteraceae bacterium]|nr:AsmA-like C-terminal region-containing protein [Candidatus Competibacteraceae bacterium]
MFLVEDAVLKTGYRRDAGGQQSAQGELAIGKLVAGTALTLTGLQSPVVMEGDRIDLPSITGKAYSGTATGKAGVDLSAAANSFYMALQLERMNLAELMAGMQAGAEAGGAVDFALDVRVRWTRRKSWPGRGRLW